MTELRNRLLWLRRKERGEQLMLHLPVGATILDNIEQDRVIADFRQHLHIDTRREVWRGTVSDVWTIFNHDLLPLKGEVLFFSERMEEYPAIRTDVPDLSVLLRGDPFLMGADGFVIIAPLIGCYVAADYECSKGDCPAMVEIIDMGVFS